MCPLVVTQAIDNNTDPAMVLSSSLGLDSTMAFSGSTGHLDGHLRSFRVALGHQHGPR